jgi:hypothetical protein
MHPFASSDIVALAVAADAGDVVGSAFGGPHFSNAKAIEALVDAANMLAMISEVRAPRMPPAHVHKSATARQATGRGRSSAPHVRTKSAKADA